MARSKKKAGPPSAGHPPRPAAEAPRTAGTDGGKPRFRQSRPLSFYIVLAIFLASRVYVLLFAEIKGSTLEGVNVNYAFCWQVSQNQGAGFYPPGFFERNLGFYGVQRKMRAASDPGHTPAEYAVEYPPLAIAWMVLPTVFLPPIPPGASKSQMAEQILAARAAMAVVDVAGFLLLVWLLPVMVPPTAGSPHYEWRLLVYCAGGLFLMHILYDRLDLLVGVLILAALGLLCRRVHYLASFAVLAVAINFKLTPAVLVPVWILGALPASALAGRWDLSRMLQLAGKAVWRAIQLLALTIAIFLPFYWLAGRDTLEFFQYHAARGLEIESTWATLDMLAGRVFGYATQTVQNFGAHHVSSQLTPILSTLSPLTTVLLLALAGVSLLLNVHSRLSESGHGEAAPLTAAQAAPALFTAYSVLFLLLGICTSKVLSPQYFLWLVPLVPLLAPPGKTAPRFMAAFLVVCLVTTAIYPYLFPMELDRRVVIDGRRVILPPTSFGVALLVLRNLLLLVFTGALWMWPWRARAAKIHTVS